MFGGKRTEAGGGGGATTRLSFRCAETRASDCVASRGGQKRSRLCTRHVFSISLFLSSPYLSRGMINSRAIVPYLEPQLFPRTLQRYRVEALFASIGQKRLIILSTTEFHGSRTSLLSLPFRGLLLSTLRAREEDHLARRYLFVLDFLRIPFRRNKFSFFAYRIRITNNCWLEQKKDGWKGISKFWKFRIAFLKIKKRFSGSENYARSRE